MKNKLLFFFLIIILSILLVKISKKDTFDADAIVLKDINYQTLEIISDNDKIKKILNKLNSIYEIDDVYHRAVRHCRGYIAGNSIGKRRFDI